ncbi:uncharacterized protein LOC110056240 [Orbicella faveolata]|uniref:uncharacterized protein LOC110056240 n=1 Tax=Orbicella faveolata TaxID=48498 RepID=UPI0009E5AEC5|nr:uncharacterized protein LOC110056240 [Orbicella faveolata]
MAKVEMKFIFIFSLLLYTNFCICRAESTSAKKNVCGATPGIPINVNLNGCPGLKGEKGEKGDSGTPCKCNIQDPNKPSAHIEAISKGDVTYQANTVIKDWSVSAPHSHLAGGMKYHDGKLTVPTPGRYYIYAQMYYKNNGRTVIRVNNNVVALVQPPVKAAKADNSGALYTGLVFNLKTGDVITLFVSSWPVNSAKVYMDSIHSFFGAFLI